MKKLILSIGLFCIIGCTTTQQRTTFNSLSSIESTTTAAFNAYGGLVIQGKIPTNDLPKVAAMYNKFQAGELLAVELAQNNTNALAPSALIAESVDLINLINLIKGGK